MIYGGCPKCKSLWEELSEATTAHFAILGKIQLAVIEQKSKVLTEVKPLAPRAANRRQEALLAFKEHKATHQEGKFDSQPT